MARPKKSTCLAPGCKKPAAPSRRGCCAACYQAAYRKIASGEVTADQLVDAGFLLPNVKVTERCGRVSPMARAIAALK